VSSDKVYQIGHIMLLFLLFLKCVIGEKSYYKISHFSDKLSHSQLKLECDLGKLDELFGENGNFGYFVGKWDN
jgi:hypothetical protein